MIVKTLSVGQLETNCYLVADKQTSEAMVIDPGDEPDRIVALIEGFEVRYIVLTHAHFDHAGALEEIREATGAEILIHKSELPVYEKISEHGALWGFDIASLPEPDVLLAEDDEILLGGLTFVVMHTPGHSPGGICIYGEGAVFTGDTLFAGSVGRTDLPGGNLRELKASFRRLMSLPGNTKVFSGHGPGSTINKERVGNLFAEEFLA